MGRRPPRTSGGGARVEDRLRRDRLRRRRTAHRLRRLSRVGRRRLLIVTGKGGVGKTSVTAAAAIAAARSGDRVLVCEMDGSGRLAASFGVGELGFDPTTVSIGAGGEVQIDAMSMDTERALREYIRLFVKIPFVDRVGSLARIFDYVADAAPGVREILAIGKVCHEVRRDNYDLVIVDAEATGHVVSQIDAPRAMSEFVHSGVIAEQTGWMSEILEDPVRTGVVVVTLAEDLPVAETSELIHTISTDTGVAVASVVVNHVPEAGLDPVAVEAATSDAVMLGQVSVWISARLRSENPVTLRLEKQASPPRIESVTTTLLTPRLWMSAKSELRLLAEMLVPVRLEIVTCWRAAICATSSDVRTALLDSAAVYLITISSSISASWQCSLNVSMLEYVPSVAVTLHASILWAWTSSV
ncbi:MAG: ArsA family ATPase [Ilumatobacteraceae bacterium]